MNLSISKYSSPWARYNERRPFHVRFFFCDQFLLNGVIVAISAHSSSQPAFYIFYHTHAHVRFTAQKYSRRRKRAPKALDASVTLLEIQRPTVAWYS